MQVELLNTEGFTSTCSEAIQYSRDLQNAIVLNYNSSIHQCHNYKELPHL